MGRGLAICPQHAIGEEHAIGEGSSRAIERRCREDVAFRVIAANACGRDQLRAV